MFASVIPAQGLHWIPVVITLGRIRPPQMRNPPTNTFTKPATTIRPRDDDDVFSQIASSLPGDGSSGLAPGAVGSDPESTAAQNAAGASGSDDGGINISTRDSIIIGVVVGGVALIAIISGVIFFISKKRRWDLLKKREEQRMRERYRLTPTPPNVYVDPEAPLLPRASSTYMHNNNNMNERGGSSRNPSPSPPPPPYPALPLYNPAAYHHHNHINRARPASIESSRGFRVGSWHRPNPSQASHSSQVGYQEPIQLSSDLSPPASLSQSHISDRQRGSLQSDPSNSNLTGGDSSNLSTPLANPDQRPPRRPKPVLPKLITRL